MSAPADAIDRYLDQLLLDLRGDARGIRRILAETEDHLRQASAEAQERGLSASEADQEAIARFGPSKLIARRFQSRLLVWPAAVSIRALVEAGAHLAVVGLLAIGVSGLLNEVFGHAFGAEMVAGDINGVTYTAPRCAELQEYAPAGYSCAEAAAYHHWNETVTYSVAAGILGLLLLAGLWLWRRVDARADGIDVEILPDGFVSIVGASVFGLAAGGLGLLTLNQMIAGKGTGSGQYLSGALVAGVVFVAFALRLFRTLDLRHAPAAEEVAP
jgi:hypothetical protein